MKADIQFFVLSAIFWCALVVAEESDQLDFGEPEYITTWLLDAERKRLNNPENFDSELNTLHEVIDSMSDYQRCHYQFLRNYQLAFQGNMNAAVLELESQLERCEDLRARIRIHALIANISVIKGQYEKAVLNMDGAIENAEQSHDDDAKLIAYSAATIVYQLLKQSDLSQKYSKVLYQLDSSTDSECKFLYFDTHAKILNGTAKESEVDATTDTCLKAKNGALAYIIYFDFVEYGLNNFNDSESSLLLTKNKIAAIEEDVLKVGYKNLTSIMFAQKARLALLLGDVDSASGFAEHSVELNQEIGDSSQYINALSVLEKIASGNQNFQSAHQYLTLKSAAEKRMFDVNQSKLLAFMTVKHANLAKGLEIEQLSKENTILALERQLSKQQAKNQRLLLVFILSILGLLGLWLIRMKKGYNHFKDVSEIDHLTKVLTRKAFEEKMATKLESLAKNNQTIQLAILDLDHFKTVNDTHGHLTGDWVLKHVVYTCKELIEEDMIIARLGGEEFCLVMFNADSETMHNKLECMRIGIADLDCSELGVELSVTASFGYTNTDKSGYDFNMLLTHADLALFEAKRQGRNQTVRYQSSMS